MRRFSYVFILLFISFSCVAQKKQFSFNPIGFTFTIPENYTLMDSSFRTIAINPGLYRNLTRFMFNNGTNMLILVFSDGTEGEENWNYVYRKEADHFLETMRSQKPHLKFKNHYSIVRLGGKKFNKVHLIGKDANEIKYNHVKLSKHYKNYQISISYTFNNDQTTAAVESELENVRFSAE